MKTPTTNERGFTLPELLVSCGLVLVLLVFGIAFAHPLDYGRQRRDAERWSGAARLVQLIGRYVHDRGTLPVGITNEDKVIGSDTDMLDLCPFLAPEYTKTMPLDPIDGSEDQAEAACDDKSSPYITGYMIKKTGDKAITVSAPLAETGQAITVSRTF